MKTRTKVLIAVGATAVVASAQIGLSVVFDPKALAQMIQEYKLLSQMYSTMNAEVITIANAYRIATTKAAWIPSTGAEYPSSRTPNTYGTSGGWVKAVNSGSGAMDGYSAATIPLQPYSAVAWDSLSPSQQDTVGRQYATVEITDSVNQNALAVAGVYRAQEHSTNIALAQLSAKASSLDPADNSATELQSQAISAALVSVREQQATNQLLATIVEQNAVQMKAQRDSQALGIAADAAEKTVPSQPIGAQEALSKRWN